MWKKSLALMAIVATIATFTTFSIPASAEGVVIKNFTFSPDTINPNNGESIDYSFKIMFDSNVTLYINQGSQTIETFGPQAVTGGHTINGEYIGRVGNLPTGAVHPDGDYLFVVKAETTGPIPHTFDSANRAFSIDSEGTAITDLTVDPTVFAPQDGQTTTISFTTDEDAYLTAVIKDGTTPVFGFDDPYDGSVLNSADDFSFDWSGRDNSGNIVSDGVYTVEITAEDEGGNTAVATVNVTVDEDAGQPGDGVLSDLTLKPSTTWDPSDKPLQIEFDLDKDVDNLTIKAVNQTTDEEVEILDESSVDSDNFEEEWEGTDEHDDFVDAGNWDIKVIAELDGEKYVEKKTIEVKYEAPKIDEAYVTKNPFDPNQDEYTYLVFKTDSDATVSVEVQETDGSSVVELMDEDDVDGDNWYAVKWDGKDDDNDIVDEDDYRFELKVSNVENDDVSDTQYYSVEVKDDEETSSNKVNIYGDYVEPIIVQDGDDVTIGYCLDDDAEEVSVEVYEGKSTSGTGDLVLVDEESQDQGCGASTFEWTGEDDDGDDMDEGVFAYKITAKKDGSSSTSEEKGYFIYGDLGGTNNGDDDDDDDDDDFDGDCKVYYTDLGSLRDEELCTAIAWATEQGIFGGYPNGTFKPYNSINRAETLKVLLEAFDASLLPPNGSNLGFWDLDPYAWYITYARTAQFYDMLDGYPDGTARLGNYINRVEMLKFALEASHSFTDADVYNLGFQYSDVERNAWYSKYLGAAYTYGLYDSQYYGNTAYLLPAQNVQRGEMALMLYRMNNEGLLD
ncbi:MAG: S-layer homology domain-containing protein [Candidatus Gracilibacteria bacterium]